jgi:predicted nucleotidyltransferase
LRSALELLLAGKAGAEMWLFGSLARGDWDARSDVDLLADDAIRLQPTQKP